MVYCSHSLLRSMSSPSQPDFDAVLRQIEQAAADLRTAIKDYQMTVISSADEQEADELNKRISRT